MKMFKRVRNGFFLVLMCTLLLGTSVTVFASTVSGNNLTASSSEKENFQNEITNYVANLKSANTITPKAISRMDNVAASARAYIGNTTMSAADVAAYVNDIKAQLDSIVKNQHEGEPTTASDYLGMTDNVETPVANYGKDVNVTLSIINLSEVPLTNLVVTPIVDVSVSKWPFEIRTTGYTKLIASIPGSKTYEDAVKGRQEITYTFKTRADVLTGYYKLDFEVKYNRNGTTETAKIASYVKAVGAPGSGTIDSAGDKEGQSSKPRIVVTGFETSPAEVYAGDTFSVAIHIKNTSQRTTVSNMQVDLKATPEGTTDNKYEAFLPTSGSNTLYIDKIPAGGTADLNIEMTAKADLTQKPYVLEVKMEYEDDKFTAYTSNASVSIPIKQASKFDSSSPEVMPESISVGSQSNVMFSIYNTGKTTLYNVQVKFKGDSISGGDTFVGKIEPGATGNVDAMLTGQAPTTDDGKIIATISYENDAGDVTTTEKEMTLMVTEAAPDMGMEGDMGMTPPEAKKFPVWIIILVIVILIIAGVVVFLKLKKKKKLQKELAEDLVDLEEIVEDKDNNEIS